MTVIEQKKSPLGLLTVEEARKELVPPEFLTLQVPATANRNDKETQTIGMIVELMGRVDVSERKRIAKHIYERFAGGRR